jgi:hypothetical protein
LVQADPVQPNPENGARGSNHGILSPAFLARFVKLAAGIIFWIDFGKLFSFPT